MTNPKIELPLTGADKILNWLAILFLTASWIIAVIMYIRSPEIVPVHFNFSGEADSYGNKLTLFVLPVLGILLFIGLTVLNRYPHRFNYPVSINEDNKKKQYAMATTFVRYLKMAIMLIFLMILIKIFDILEGGPAVLGNWFLPTVLGMLLIPTAIFIVRSYRN